VTDVVLDSSAVLALLRDEPGAERVAATVPGAALCVVNLAEVLTVLERHGVPAADAARSVELLALRPVDADVELARAAAGIAGVLRGRGAGLSLGDSFSLATGRTLGLPVVTADRAWGKLDVGVKVEVIR
jgi:PIN domain nuclease of toxin-antitoxin system